MPKFQQALYQKNNETRLVNVERIPHEEDYEDFINHLYCPDENCDIKLVYARTRDGGYLKKIKGLEHDDSCVYADDEVRVVSETVYIERNGNVSSEGISRRNKNTGKKLRDFLNPPEEKEKEQPDKKKRKNIKKKPVVTEDGSNKIGIRIKYDPNSEVSKEELEQGGRKTREPAFITVLLHQISERDANKNLSTVGLIEEVMVNTELSTASINVSFENTQAIFQLPPAFFNNSIRGLVKDQLFEYLDILGNYIKRKPNSLYINTLCQTHRIDMDKLVLYIYDPDFPSFILSSNPDREFESLSTLVSMISTNAI